MMKKIVVLITVIAFSSILCADGMILNKDVLLIKIRKIAPFKVVLEKGMTKAPAKAKAYYVKKKTIAPHIIWAKAKAKNVLKNFGSAVVFVNAMNILAISKWKNQTAATQFEEIEKAFLTRQDKRNKKLVLEANYSEIKLDKGIIFVAHKKVKLKKQQYAMTTFTISSHGYMLEGNFVGKHYSTDYLKNFIGSVWKILSIK